jgi:hypothetical protein
MGKRGGQLQECITVFLAAMSGLAGAYGIYNTYTQNQIPIIVWMSALFTFNYWLCFYRLNKNN